MSRSFLDDPEIAAAMIYCGDRGIPVMRFLGRDEPGADWDPISREIAIEWAIRERTVCSGCGTHPDDWDESKGGDREAFEVAQRYCHGDHLLAQARKANEDPATFFYLRRRRRVVDL